MENGGGGDQRQLEEQMNEGVAYGRRRNEELDNVSSDETTVMIKKIIEL